MNKNQLIDAIAEEAEISKTHAKQAFEAFCSVTAKTLQQGDKISVAGFGSFSVSEKPARTGRNPRTGEVIEIQAKKVIKFKAGANFCDLVE